MTVGFYSVKWSGNNTSFKASKYIFESKTLCHLKTSKQHVTFAAFHHCKTPSDDFKIRTCKADCLVCFKKDKIEN